jgi:pimeloyl-ACP methyl ester carboxylesterase
MTAHFSSIVRRPLRTLSRRGALVPQTAAIAAMIGLTAVSPAHGDTDDAVSCWHVAAIPVAIAPGQPAGHTVNGELCASAPETRTGTAVQLLIHGAFYNHSYWDFATVNGIAYSYARDVAARGIPTFAIDELGAGGSSRPPSDQLTVQAATYVAHQIVQGLRSGAITGVRFGKVIDVGHSLGSVVVWQEAINYGDVDGVIFTGAAHSLAARFGQLAGTDVYPAVQDPKFAASGLDGGYLTTVPGTRETLFYSLRDADPAVIAQNEQRKDVTAATELNTALPTVPATGTLAIHVPVLDVLGSNDLTICEPNGQGQTFDCSSGAAVAAQEAPHCAPEAQIHGCVISGSGHSISLALNHRLQVEDTVAWSFAYVGKRGSDDHSTGDRAHGRLPRRCG